MLSMYTTDTIPLPGYSLCDAWLVHAADVSLSRALEELSERARTDGATAIIGLRIAPSAVGPGAKDGLMQPWFHVVGTAVIATATRAR